MIDVVKKGLIEVKKRGRFGGYKPKYVSLINNSVTHKCKTVELLDPDGLKSTPDVIRLTDVWSVQDKASKTRYSFELVLGEDPVITFSCATMVEREEWTEAFRVLNLLALPSLETLVTSSPHTEYSPVNLLKNRSAIEIGRYGQFLLSITSSAIVLHWKTGAIAHHWPTKNVLRLHHPGKDGHLFLIVKRVSGSGPHLEFEFVATTKEQAVQILKLWNVRLLESIPGQPHSINDISLSSAVMHTGGKTKRKSKSFKDKDRRIENQEDLLQRTSSFSRFNSYGTGLSVGSSTLSQGSQPIAAGQRISWNEFSLESQDSSYSSRFGPGASSPPPLPPRPVESSSDEDDPDYAYIDEREVKGPSGAKVQRTPSDELDDQLKELRKSINRENRAKQKLRRGGTSPQFVQADPEDYLIPVPSKRSQSHSTSSVSRDLSDPVQDLSPSSPDNSPVFRGPPPSLPPRVSRSYGVNENTDAAAKDYSTPAPPIPPRSPTREYLSRKSSSSSSHSAGSAGHHHRCPKCHSLKKSKSSVSKTVSDSQEKRSRSSVYGHRTTTKEESRKSMPNLEHEVKNHHRHCCSSQDSLTTQSREYLQLVEDKGPMQERGMKQETRAELGELSSELDLLSSCLEALNNPLTETQSPTKKKRNPYDHINIKKDEPPPPEPPSRHRPLTGSQSVRIGPSITTLPSRRTHLNGHTHHRSLGDQSSRSQGSLSLAPPIPPRSSTSLGNEVSNGVSRAGRSATLHSKQNSTPARSSSVMDHASGYHGNGRYGYDSASQVEASSNTVFIQHVSHHLKDRPRLAHMV